MKFNKSEEVQRFRLVFDGTKKRSEDLLEWLNTSQFKRKYSFYLVQDGEGYSLEVYGRTSRAKRLQVLKPGNVLLWCYVINELEVLETPADTTKPTSDTRPPLNEFQLRYVNKVAPEHCRTSCSDENLYNAWYGKDDVLFGRCTRCTLLQAALGYLPPKEDED